MDLRIVPRRERDGTLTDVYLDDKNRKVKTIRKRPDGTTRQVNTYAYPVFSGGMQAESCVQTAYWADGATPEYQVDLAFNRKTRKFDAFKRTYFDESGRKVRTDHTPDGATRTYASAYWYRGSGKQMAAAEKTDFWPDGHTPQKKTDYVCRPVPATSDTAFLEAAWTTFDRQGKQNGAWADPALADELRDNRAAAAPATQTERPSASFLHRLKKLVAGR
ncbi:MAG: hypothetical protein PHX68_04220 [Alphaproteobacteria bacterium]|nr:hypothetical protein [Alphaproteobacteria bacterium]